VGRGLLMPYIYYDQYVTGLDTQDEIGRCSYGISFGPKARLKSRICRSKSSLVAKEKSNRREVGILGAFPG
jgi:hypothetical protein